MPKDLAPNRLSVDQLLDAQSHQPFKGTIQALDGRPDAVKLTPWLPRAGCLCDMSLIIPSSSIDFVMSTGEVHICCGQSLRVVEVRFVEDATIPVKDLFGQVSSRAMIVADRMEQAHEFADRVARQAARDVGFQGAANVPFHQHHRN